MFFRNLRTRFFKLLIAVFKTTQKVPIQDKRMKGI